MGVCFFMSFKDDVKKLDNDISPLLFDVIEEYNKGFCFMDDEYFYNHQVDYLNHSRRFVKYCDKLERYLNNFFGFNGGVLDKLFDKLFERRVKVDVDVDINQMRIFLPVFNRSDKLYSRSLVLFNFFDSFDKLYYAFHSGNYNVYEIDID